MSGPTYTAPLGGATPPNVPAEIESIRGLLRLGRLFALVFMILGLVVGVVGLIVWFGGYNPYGGGGGYGIIVFVLSLLIYLQVPSIERHLEMGQLSAAKEATLLWAVLGLFAWILPGLFLLLAYLKYDSAINWQRYGMGSPPMAASPTPSAWNAPAQNGWGQPTSVPTTSSWGAPPTLPQSSTPAAAAPATSSPSPAPASQSYTYTAPAAAAPPAASAPPSPPVTCPRCNQPATWIAQYSRWYCYTDAQYV